MKQYFQYQDDDLFIHHTYSSLSLNKGTSVMHAHDDFELFFFISGDCAYNVEGNQYKLTPGCLLLMRPAEVHCLIADQDPCYERVVINFSQQLVKKIDPECLLLQPFTDRALGQKNLYKPEDLYAGFSRALMQIVSQDRPRGNDEIAVMIRANLYQLLYEIREAFFRKLSLPAASTSENEVSKLIRFINENIAGDLSLGAIADQFFLSKSQISRVFKQLTGTTLSNYIAAKRLILAREKMLAGEPAKEVSQHCGYNDYSVFYRAYRKKYGVSPVRQHQ